MVKTRWPELIVLPPSHYCERARWALDHIGQDYRELRWAPGLHAVLAKRRGWASSSTPILNLHSDVIQGSDKIMDWCAIGGADRDLELRFEKKIGRLVRQYLYAATLSAPASGIKSMVLDGVPAWQSLVGGVMWPNVRKRMIELMNARPELVQSLEAELEAELAWFDARVGNRCYLVGDAFGRADITAASLLSPLARPAALPIYGKIKLPPNVEAALGRWSERPGLRWVKAMYERERRLPYRVAS
jgi:glutathione S-transferase